MAKTKPTLRWLQLDAKQQPLRWRKEVIYTGDFDKDGPFSIDLELLNRMAESVAELRLAGVEVPFANGHDDWMNSANRLGDVVGAAVEPNDKGIPALFLDIDFKDEAARSMATKSDVSIGYLGEFKDGKGVMHNRVLRHLASTSAPIIPSLSEWAALAASFAEKTTSTMSTEIHTLLGVDSDEAALGAIKELQEKAKPVEKVELSFPPLVIRTLRDSREQQLEGMVKSGDISPAVKAELVLAFANDKQVGLELSQGSNGEGFEFAIKLAKLASKSKPVSPTGRTSAPGENEVVLSHDGGDKWLDRFATWSKRHNKSTN